MQFVINSLVSWIGTHSVFESVSEYEKNPIVNCHAYWLKFKSKAINFFILYLKIKRCFSIDIMMLLKYCEKKMNNWNKNERKEGKIFRNIFKVFIFII